MPIHAWKMKNFVIIVGLAAFLSGCLAHHPAHRSKYEYDANAPKSWGSINTKEKQRDFAKWRERQRCEVVPRWSCIGIWLNN